MLVSIQLTCSSTEENFTITVLVVIHRTPHYAMVNASGSSQGADPYNSMCQNQGTISSATANYRLILHSAMERIK